MSHFLTTQVWLIGNLIWYFVSNSLLITFKYGTEMSFFRSLALVVNILEVFSLNIIALNNVSNLLVTFNSSVNLVIYCIFGDKFKRIFCQLFCQRARGRRDGTNQDPFLTRYPIPPTISTTRNCCQNVRDSRGHQRVGGQGIEDTYGETTANTSW